MATGKSQIVEGKSKEAEKKRKEDTHNKMIWGGIVKKYLRKPLTLQCFLV